MSAPVLYCDVDGVLVPFASRSAYRKNPKAFGYMAKAEVISDLRKRMYNIDYSRDLVAKMVALRADTGFSWVWLTTWLDSATNRLGPRLGIDDTTHLDWDPDTDLVGTVVTAWGSYLKDLVDEDVTDDVRAGRKYAALLTDLTSNPRPFVWVDDVATVKYAVADFTGALDVPHLIVATDPLYGINHDDYAKIKEFFTVHAVN